MDIPAASVCQSGVLNSSLEGRVHGRVSTIRQDMAKSWFQVQAAMVLLWFRNCCRIRFGAAEAAAKFPMWATDALRPNAIVTLLI